MGFVTRGSAAYRYGERAAEINQRLRRPPNAVKDEGIDLRRHRKTPRKYSQVEIEPQRVIKPFSNVKLPSSPYIPRVSVMEIRNYTCQFYGVPLDKMLADCRKPVIALCRHVAIYMIRDKLKKSWGEIMPFFAYRDHTTLLHSYKVIKGKLLFGDTELGQQIEEMWNAIVAIKSGSTHAPKPQPAVAHEYKDQADLLEPKVRRLEETSSPPLDDSEA
jgi:hypothetical protein